jgi:hypothetical protein
MKKLVLFALAITMVIGVSAQKSNNPLLKELMRVENLPLDNYAPVNSNGVLGGNTSKDLVYVGKAGNIYYALLSEQQCMNYDETSGLMQMIHRADPATYPEANNDNGSIVSSQSVDGGATWTYKMLLPFDGSDKTRYPQGFILNTEGNIDPSEVIIGATGPSFTGVSWNKNFFVSALNDEELTEKEVIFYNMHNSFEAARLGTAATENGYVYALSHGAEDDGSVYTEYNLYLYRGVKDGMHVDFSNANDYFYKLGDIMSMMYDNWWSYNGGMAWSEDGSIGYIFGYGIIPELGGQSGMNPVVWKSVDNGETWTLMTGGMDMFNFPGLEDFMLPNVDGDYIPMFLDRVVAGTVDVNGDLQFFGLVASGSTTNPDEFGFVDENEPVKLINVTINSETGITGVKFIANMIGEEVPTSSEYAYAPGPDAVGWDHRVQASRSKDGKSYFVVWGDTEDAANYNGENAHPDIYVWGHSLDYYTFNNPVLKLTSTGSNWFHYASDRVVPLGGAIYSIPVTQTVTALEMVMNTDLDPVTISYIPNLEYDVSVGIEEEAMNNATIDVSQNQPNPFSGVSTIRVSLDRKAELSLEVYNAIGQKVYAADKGVVAAGAYNFQLDATDFETGVYYYQVKAGNTTVNKKMIVQ